MVARCDLSGPCPTCGGGLTVTTESGEFTGRLRTVPFREIPEDRVRWQNHQRDSYALLADLVALGVLSHESVVILILDLEDGTVVPIGLATGTPINRRPLLDALAPQLRPRCSLPQREAAEALSLESR